MTCATLVRTLPETIRASVLRWSCIPETGNHRFVPVFVVYHRPKYLVFCRAVLGLGPLALTPIGLPSAALEGFMSTDERKLHPVNVRMKNLRLSLGYPKPGKFAQMLGISIARWCNVEIGHPLTHNVAVILKSKIPGLSYDYIYDGDVETLGDELRMVLGERPSKKSLPSLPLGPDFDKPVAPKNNDNNYRPPTRLRRKASGG
jgi:hypothetical protein